MSPHLIALVIVLIIICIYALSNIPPTDIRFFIWHISVSKALLSLVPLMVGIIIGVLLAGVGSEKKKRR